MWYSALEVARYIITKCSEAGKPISNLKLQKVLYFIWIDFYRETRRTLFMDDICAWQLGPVVPEVYYQYCSYAGRPIYEFYSPGIVEEDARYLDQFINKYIGMSANELVNRTHEPGTAWDVIYQNGDGNRTNIPFTLIIDKEVD